MNESKNFLGTESIGKLLLKLAVPTVIAQLVNMLYNLVDRIYIGHIPEIGKLSLTGVGVCMPIILIISAFSSFTASGGAPYASIHMGKGENEKAEKILGGCFSMQVIISIIITILLLFFSKELLMIFGASENTIEYASKYMNIYVIGTIFVQLTLGMNAFITTQGFAKTGMITIIIGAIINIILDPILIYGFNMGVEGAALATIISQGISCIWVISFLFGKKTMLKLKTKNFIVNAKYVLPCLALGSATFIMQSSESVISICFNSSLLKYGGDIAVGAMTILTSVMQFAMLPLQGISQGAQPILSYNYGSKNSNRVKNTFKLLLKVCFTYSFILWTVIMFFPKVFALIFTPDQELIVFTTKALRIYCGALFMFGIQIACQMTFVSIGNAIASISVAVVRKFVLLIPLIYIIPSIVSNKTVGVYMAEPVADFTAVCFTMILFYFQFKKSIRKIEPNFNNINIKCNHN